MKKYSIVFVDDEVEIIKPIMEAVSGLLKVQSGYEIEYTILKNQSDIDNMHNMIADVVLFDCALGAASLNFGDSDETTYGVELMRKFREKNNRTKIIFYSGRFALKGSQCYDFTNMEMLYLINELHVYKMIPKNAEEIFKAIVAAINDLEPVILSLEELIEEYHNEGEFLVCDKLYSINDLLAEIKKNSDIGEKFRKDVYKLVLTYMMKFGGDDE